MDYTTDRVFAKVISFILNAEGDYSNDPHDPGGPTKFGIATNFNQGELARLRVKDVKDLTLEQAKEIYYRKYWLASEADMIVADARLAYMHFDCAVNQGVGASKSILLKLSRKPADLEGNGKNDAVFLRLLIEYAAHRLHRYTTDRTGFKRFGAGWSNRIANLLLACVRMLP